MPRVKIDYVVSFSSEDPEHPANNLLQREVSKKKWLCRKGESTCSVVLQLARAVKISAVHIGAYHAALVEVLVARSETANGENFQVLVPRSVFATREESRRGEPLARVRSFSAEQLGAARHQRWDRLRLVCDQPYDRHCQFGISFVHIDEAEADVPAAAVPPRLLALDTFSSDEDDFKPGELFAKHQQKTSAATEVTNTSAQIKQATSQALKNISGSSTKLIKTPISKPTVKRDTMTSERSGERSSEHSKERSSERSAECRGERRGERDRETLLYTRDDDAPHARIDSVLHRHRPDKQHNKPNHAAIATPLKHEPQTTTKRTASDSSPATTNDTAPSTSIGNERKRRRPDNKERPAPQAAGEVGEVGEVGETGAVSGSPHRLLRGVVLVLSGYENPRRADLRRTALALGADVRREWDPHCTHLICAFPNTPKLRTVRSVGGDRVPVATADWIEECSRRRRLLPWRWFATESKHLIKPTQEDLLDDTSQPDSPHERQDPQSDYDTDNEIEKVIQAQKNKRITESNVTIDEPNGGSSGDIPAKEEEEEEELSTEEECGGEEERAGAGAALPDFLDGVTVALDAAPHLAAHLARYVRAYAGRAVHLPDLQDGAAVDYVVRGAGAGSAGAGPGPGPGAGGAAPVVGAAWLARCHAAGALLPHSS